MNTPDQQPESNQAAVPRSPTSLRLSRRTLSRGAAGSAALIAITAAQGRALGKSRRNQMIQATPVASTPTVVLVHGAFADGSSWSGVIEALTADGVPVIAAANPLRSLSADAAYIASVASRVNGPVVLVGHSYGGAVITNAALQAPNVIGLVYVAAFIPDDGETLLGLATQATDSLLGPALRPGPFVAAPGGDPGNEFLIDPASFQAVFCADVPADLASVMAVTQRPTTEAAFGEPTANAAWKSLPSWALVATADKAIGVTGSRLMAQRSGATTVEVDGSHAVMVSQPAAVADLIRTALAASG